MAKIPLTGDRLKREKERQMEAYWDYFSMDGKMLERHFQRMTARMMDEEQERMRMEPPMRRYAPEPLEMKYCPEMDYRIALDKLRCDRWRPNLPAKIPPAEKEESPL